MEEVKSLQLKGEKGSVMTLEELNAKVGKLTASVEAGISREGQPSEQPPIETAMQKIFREAEEGRSPDDLDKAEAWVIRQIGGRLKLQEGPIDHATKAGRQALDRAVQTGKRLSADLSQDRRLEIVFDKYVATQELRDAGKTTLPDGFTVTHSVSVPVLARYYIDIILDEGSYQSDAEKLLAIVEDSKQRCTHPTEFRFLFHASALAAVLDQLKPLRRRRRKKQR